MDDLQEVQSIQMLDCNVKGRWDFTIERRSVFVVDNADSIDLAFAE